jgi:hypothetical protein
MQELSADAFPLGFLVGTWQGEGVGSAGSGTDGDFRYRQELRFAQLPGEPVLTYSSRWWRLDDAPAADGADSAAASSDATGPVTVEAGFWRMADGYAEVTLAHPDGIAEVYVGEVDRSKIELLSNVLVRTATAEPVERFQRLYGLLPTGELGYVVEIARPGSPLAPYLAATLTRLA